MIQRCPIVMINPETPYLTGTSVTTGVAFLRLGDPHNSLGDDPGAALFFDGIEAVERMQRVLDGLRAEMRVRKAVAPVRAEHLLQVVPNA